MKFQLLSLTPASSHSRTACDWTQQELAEFYRVHDILLKAGLHVEFDRGVTDEGDPWCVFCRPPTGDVIIHFARCDGTYIVASSPFGAVLQGKDFRQIVDSFIARQPLILPGQRDGSSVSLHPTALLTALVATALFLLDQNDAEAARPSHDPQSDAPQPPRAVEPFGENNGFTALVHMLLEPLRPNEQREALIAISAIVAGMASLNYASEQLPLINSRTTTADSDNAETARLQEHDVTLDIPSSDHAGLASKIGFETSVLGTDAAQGADNHLVIDLSFKQLTNTETQTLQELLVKPTTISTNNIADINLKHAENIAAASPFEALLFVASGQTALELKRSLDQNGGSATTGSATDNSIPVHSAAVVAHSTGPSDGSNEARLQSQLASSVKNQFALDETASVKSSEVTVCVPGNVEKFHGLIFDSVASNLLRLASLPTLQTIDLEVLTKASLDVVASDKQELADLKPNNTHADKDVSSIKQAVSQYAVISQSDEPISKHVSASWSSDNDGKVFQHNQAALVPSNPTAAGSSAKNPITTGPTATSDGAVTVVSSPDIEARAISALAHFMKANPDFAITQKGRDIVLFENNLAPAGTTPHHVHSWDFEDGSRVTIVGSLSGFSDA